MFQRIKSATRTFIAEKPLWVCLICAVALSCIGLNWGINECWNLDQMGHLKLRKDYMPAHYLKPPPPHLHEPYFYTRSRQASHGGVVPNLQGLPLARIFDRLTTPDLALFCGFLAAIYFSAKETSDLHAAFAITLILATSSGILVFNRFLTADSPLLFWMAISFAFAVRGGLRASNLDAVLAGLFAGLAAANKYNGLGVAAAIPAALFAAQGWRFIQRPAPWLAGLAIPVGFIVGCPGAVLDTRRFVDDFIYNYLTTPVYDGQSDGTGYVKFLACFPDLLGWPVTALLALFLLGTALVAVRGRLRSAEWILIASSLAVFGLYYLMIGKFPRMGTRFVLPAVPFLLLLAVPSLARVDWSRWAPKAVLGLLVLYNIYASIDAGLRFLNDPRMESIAWVKHNIPPESTIENSYAPDWRRIPERNYQVAQMPAATGRKELFTNILGNKKTIQEGLNRFEMNYDKDTFSKGGLDVRIPDYIAFTTQVFEWSGDDDAQRFYAAIDREEFGYLKVYEKEARQRWPIGYPLRIDFIADRMVILKRRTENLLPNH